MNKKEIEKSYEYLTDYAFEEVEQYMEDEGLTKISDKLENTLIKEAIEYRYNRYTHNLNEEEKVALRKKIKSKLGVTLSDYVINLEQISTLNR